MTQDPSPPPTPPVDPAALLAELEAAFAKFDEARVRLHQACAGSAQGIVDLDGRLGRLEADLETAKNHLAHTKTEADAEREQAQLRIAALEGELAALKEAHDGSVVEADAAKAAAEAAQASSAAHAAKVAELEAHVTALTDHATQLAIERDAHGQHAASVEAELLATREALEAEIAALGQDQERASTESSDANAAAEAHAAKIAELELTVASVTEHASQLVLERDAHTERAQVVERELAAVREALARRPGLDYVAAIEKQKARAEEELAALRVEVERLRRELAGVRTRLSKSTSSTRIAIVPPPETKAFEKSSVTTKSAEKPPGALNLDELMNRAKVIRNPAT